MHACSQRCRVFGDRPADAVEYISKHRRVVRRGTTNDGLFDRLVSYYEDTHRFSVFGVKLFIQDLVAQLDI
jgi:hypothetical protein